MFKFFDTEFINKKSYRFKLPDFYLIQILQILSLNSSIRVNRAYPLVLSVIHYLYNTYTTVAFTCLKGHKKSHAYNPCCLMKVKPIHYA